MYNHNYASRKHKYIYKKRVRLKISGKMKPKALNPLTCAKSQLSHTKKKILISRTEFHYAFFFYSNISKEKIAFLNT